MYSIIFVNGWQVIFRTLECDVIEVLTASKSDDNDGAFKYRPRGKDPDCLTGDEFREFLNNLSNAS